MELLVVTLLLSGVTLSAADGLFEKALVFPNVADNSYAKLSPQWPLELNALTLCMNVVSEQEAKREVVLFQYRTRKFNEIRNEINVWRESDQRYSFYMSGEGVSFDIPPLSTMKSQMCITWESNTGLTGLWVDGKRSVRKVYKPGHRVQPNCTVILGQDPCGGFMKDYDSQSFVGEISNVNMWDHVLPERQIKALHLCGGHAPKGNVLDWDTVRYKTYGKVFSCHSNCEI